MADLLFLKGTQFPDNSGNPLNGGKLRFYDAGTSNARTVYKDSGALTAWAAPIVLDSAGRLEFSVYIPEGAFKLTLHTSAEVQIFSEDNIPGATASASIAYARPQRPLTTKAANYTITSDDLGKLFAADATGGSFTLTLPSAADVASGKGVDVLMVGTVGSVTIATVAAQTINGSASFVLRGQYTTARITSDGANWYAEPFEIQRTSPAAKTSAYTIRMADEGKLILADATSAGFTVTLPTVASAGNGFRIGIKKTDASANAVTVDGDGSETIDGAANYSLAVRYDTIWLRCDGSAWHIEAAPLTTAAQTITGTKTFTTAPIIPTSAYDASSWNGSQTPAPKDAVRDKIETMGTQVLLVRTSVGTEVSYQMNNLSGYRELRFIFEELSLNGSSTILFQVGVAGPTFRTSGYLTISSQGGTSTNQLVGNPVTSSAHIAKTVVVRVWNAGDAGEKTVGHSSGYYDIASDELVDFIGRYDTAEANTCFRIISSNGTDVLDGGFATILGIP